jgi:RimJ/RimL family protein N-acetyltransferase
MTDVILIPVEQWGGDAVHFLYDLLGERRPEVNISHKAMPTYAEHEAFVRSSPFQGWWLIVRSTRRDGDKAMIFHEPVGSCYITKMGEIGIQISAAHQRKGYARTALNTLIEMHRGRRLLANIAPGNEASRKLFEGFGFRMCQHTFELEQRCGK